MARGRWLAVVLPMLVAAGCREDGDDDTRTATAGSATFTVVYDSNGHPVAAESEDGDVRSRETELETLTNDYRVSKGLNALAVREDVREVSRAHSEHMILHAFFAHDNPEGDWPWDRATRAGLIFLGYGENIAGGFATAQDAFNGFLASTDHRQNIEDPRWVGHGQGYAFSADSHFQHYWTQNFIRP